LKPSSSRPVASLVAAWNSLIVLPNARFLNTVIDAETVFVVLDETGVPQKHELLRNVGLGPVQQCRQMANTLFIIPKRVEQPQARRMCDGTQYSHGLQVSFRHEIALQTIFTMLNTV
jgi:hypothetical protein